MLSLKQEGTNMKGTKVEVFESMTEKRVWANRQELTGKTVNGGNVKNAVWYEYIPLDGEASFVPTGRSCSEVPMGVEVLPPRTPHRYKIN